MRVIPIDEVTSGMRLGRPIFRSKDGRILLQTNIELTASYIQKIKALKQTHICILEPEELMEASPQPLKELTRVKAKVTLRRIIHQLNEKQTVDVDGLKKIVNETIDQILSDSFTVYNLTKIKAFDTYTFSHSINVCVISLLMGAAMDVGRSDLEILGIGSILHDIGKIFITENILNKPTKLEPDEYRKIKEHTRDGYEVIKANMSFSFLPAHVALQHHEREDGSGYPRGLSGKDIHKFAKIVAVADVYDAMTTPRIYQQEVPSHVAIQEICVNKVRKYDNTVIHFFKKVVAPYPLGSTLLLNNGQDVEVTYVSRERCLVKVRNGMHQGEIYNLFQEPDLRVLARIT